jgi:diguanylate cyclase (GGDEF)-like protein
MDAVNLYRSINKTNKKVFLAAIILFTAVSMTISLSVYTLYLQKSEYQLRNIKKAEKMVTNIVREMMLNRIDKVIKDIQIVSSLNTARYYFDSKQDVFRQEFQKDLSSISEISKEYDQLRFIDKNGIEKVRINYEYGSVINVADEKLQDKSDRYYFKDTISLGKNEVYLSPLDLNIEGGMIEIPFKPMLRIGTPVFDTSGKKQGAVIINYSAKDMMNRIDKLSENAYGNAMLTNKKGYWLKSNLKEDEWGFMLPERDSRTFSNDYPNEWIRMSANDSGQFITENGVFTYTTIYPLRAGLISSSGTTGLLSKNNSEIVSGNEYYWKYIQHIPKEKLSVIKKANTYDRISTFIVIYLLSIIPGFLLAYFYAKNKMLRSMLAIGERYDYLTRLPNRNSFYEILDKSFGYCSNYHKSLSVMFIDINNLKNINHQYGSGTTNTLIYKYSEMFSKCLKNSGTLAKLKSTDFGVIMTDVKSIDEIKEIAECFIKSIEKGIVINGREVKAGINIGIATFPEDAFEKSDLINKAKASLKVSKELGINRVAVFDTSLISVEDELK